MPRRPPTGLGKAGRALWRDVADEHDLDPVQRVLLVEACRMVDRLDTLHAVLSGEPAVWERLLAGAELPAGSAVVVYVDGVLRAANSTADTLKKTLASLRLPNKSGRRPRRRPPRGVYVAGGR